jgi:hypothetical protein
VQLVDGERLLAAPGAHRQPGHPDDVAQVDVDATCAALLHDELDPPRAVD